MAPRSSPDRYSARGGASSTGSTCASPGLLRYSPGVLRNSVRKSDLLAHLGSLPVGLHRQQSPSGAAEVSSERAVETPCSFFEDIRSLVDTPVRGLETPLPPVLPEAAAAPPPDAPQEAGVPETPLDRAVHAIGVWSARQARALRSERLPALGVGGVLGGTAVGTRKRLPHREPTFETARRVVEVAGGPPPERADSPNRSPRGRNRDRIADAEAVRAGRPRAAEAQRLGTVEAVALRRGLRRRKEASVAAAAAQRAGREAAVRELYVGAGGAVDAKPVMVASMSLADSDDLGRAQLDPQVLSARINIASAAGGAPAADDDEEIPWSAQEAPEGLQEPRSPEAEVEDEEEAELVASPAISVLNAFGGDAQQPDCAAEDDAVVVRQPRFRRSPTPPESALLSFHMPRNVARPSPRQSVAFSECSAFEALAAASVVGPAVAAVSQLQPSGGEDGPSSTWAGASQSNAESGSRPLGMQRSALLGFRASLNDFWTNSTSTTSSSDKWLADDLAGDSSRQQRFAVVDSAALDPQNLDAVWRSWRSLLVETNHSLMGGSVFFDTPGLPKSRHRGLTTTRPWGALEAGVARRRQRRDPERIAGPWLPTSP